MSKVIFKLPEWTRNLPNNACLRSNEVGEILGYKKSSANNATAVRGRLGIESNNSIDVIGRCSKSRTVQYSLGELRKLEGKEI